MSLRSIGDIVRIKLEFFPYSLRSCSGGKTVIYRYWLGNLRKLESFQRFLSGA